MKNGKNLFPKELVKPSGLDQKTKSEAVEFLCREYGAGTDCRINKAIDESDDILF